MVRGCRVPTVAAPLPGRCPVLRPAARGWLAIRPAPRLAGRPGTAPKPAARNRVRAADVLVRASPARPPRCDVHPAAAALHTAPPPPTAATPPAVLPPGAAHAASHTSA